MMGSSQRRGLEGALAGAVTMVWLTVLTGAGFMLAALPFPPFVLFDWEARVLPAGLLDLTVGAVVALVHVLHLGPTASAAKVVEHAVGVAQLLLLGALAGAPVTWLGRRVGARTAGLGVGGALGAGFAAMAAKVGFGPAWWLGAAWLVLAFVVWGALTAAWLTLDKPATSPGRRRVLYWTGLAGLAAGAAALLAGPLRPLLRGGTSGQTPPPADTTASAWIATSGPAASPPREALADRFPPAPGTRPELTPPGHFYRIDIDSTPAGMDAASWRLELSGMVANPVSLSLVDLHSMPAITQAITLSCISNPVGGDLISTGYYTGVPFREIVARAGPAASVAALNMRCADGYHESMPMETAMDQRTLLVYELNGDPLPPAHGFPARVYIPDRYGMKQPKWITAIEFAREAVPGFWVKRGWSREATVRTTSVVDTQTGDLAPPAAGRVTAGGIAYSGARGISRVQVRVDDGPWREAELRTPPLSPLTWVQWRLEVQVSPGSHTFTVRAWDDDGRPQVAEEHDSFPAGATGLFSRTLDVTRRAARRLPRRAPWADHRRG